MSYIPILWLGFSGAVLFRRPGFLLGSVFSAYQYVSYYDNPALGPVLLLIFLAFTAFTMVVRGRIRALSRLEFLLALFALLYLLSTLYSPDIEAGIVSVARFLTVCLGYYVIGRVFASHERYREQFIFDFGFSVILLSVVFAYLTIAEQGVTGRLRVSEGSPVGFSQALDVAVGFCLFYLLSRPTGDGWIKKLAVLAMLFAVLIVALLNGTRGTVASLVLAAAVYITITIFTRSPGFSWRRRIAPLGFVLLAVAVIFSQFIVGAHNDALTAALHRIMRGFDSSGFYVVDPSVAMRLDLLREAWVLFTESPLIGHGVGSYDALTGLGYPHNVFAELLVETGLVTTMLFVVILAGYGLMGLRLLKLSGISSNASIAVGLFLVAVAHQQISFALWMAKPMFLFMGVIAALYYQASTAQRMSVRSSARSVQVQP